MSQSQDFLTTQGFAKKAGVSASTVSKWLRSGKIDGQKKNGRWLIAENEISKVATSQKKHTHVATQPKATPDPKPAVSQSGGSTYSVEAFSQITYLTEYGVKLWLRTGRLISAMDDSGRPGVDASSLDQPHIKRLLR